MRNSIGFGLEYRNSRRENSSMGFINMLASHVKIGKWALFYYYIVLFFSSMEKNKLVFSLIYFFLIEKNKE